MAAAADRSTAKYIPTKYNMLIPKRFIFLQEKTHMNQTG